MPGWGTGDSGSTGLFGQGRVSKDAPQPEACGALDEATSFLGLAKVAGAEGRTAEMVEDVQRDLYVMMAELSSTEDYRDKLPSTIGDEQCRKLDALCTEVEAGISLPNQFILPGGCPASAQLDVARSVVRRAERVCVGLRREGLAVSEHVLRYLNRLSTLLYLLARLEDDRKGALQKLAKERKR